MVVDYKDWQIPLGRRFRSLKLWMVLRLYGQEGLQSYIRNHIALAKQFEELVIQDSRFEVVTPRRFSLVCFRLLPRSTDENQADKLNRALLDAVNLTGTIFISHTVLSGKYVLRLAVGAPLTEERHVIAAWKVLQEKATALLEGNVAQKPNGHVQLSNGVEVDGALDNGVTTEQHVHVDDLPTKSK